MENKDVVLRGQTIAILRKEDGERLHLGLAKVVLYAQSLKGGKSEVVNNTLNSEFVRMVYEDYPFLTPKEVQIAVVDGLKRRTSAYTTISIMLLRELLDEYTEERERKITDNAKKYE